MYEMPILTIDIFHRSKSKYTKKFLQFEQYNSKPELGNPFMLVRKYIDVNEHKRLFDFTLRHKLK